MKHVYGLFIVLGSMLLVGCSFWATVHFTQAGKPDAAFGFGSIAVISAIASIVVCGAVYDGANKK